MNKKQKLKLLREWKNLYVLAEKQYVGLKDVCGSGVENPITTLTYDILGKYTKLVSEKVGDEQEWLDWFVWENDLGKKCLQVSLYDGILSIKVKSIEDLLFVIEKTK